MNKSGPRIFLPALLAGLLLSGCALNQDFQKAQVENSLQGWAEFTQKYPVANHPNCDECKIAQQNYEAALASQKAQWSQVSEEDTPAAYLRFLNANSPDNSHYAEAREKALSELEEGRGTSQDYARYLSLYPEEPAASQLRRVLSKLRYKKALDSGSSAAETLFVEEYPGTSLGKEMGRHLESAEFKNARQLDTRLAYEFFLKRFPSAPQRAEAEAALSSLPAAVRLVDDGADLSLLPRLREASPALRGLECSSLFRTLMERAGNPYGAMAEGIRSEFFAGNQSSGGLPVICADTKMIVPGENRVLVSSALKALARLAQREQTFSQSISNPSVTVDKAKEIGKSADILAQQAESFDLEMQAFYGYMPADPDKPSEKASKDAKEAERRAKRAFEIASLNENNFKNTGAGAVLSLMERQADLLTRIIAFYERPERTAQ